MSELRSQLGVVMPDIDNPIVKDDGTATLEFHRVVERMVNQLKNDDLFIHEVNQNTKDSELDELRTQIETNAADIGTAQDTADAAAQAAEDAATQIISIADEASDVLNTRLEEATASLNRSAEDLTVQIDDRFDQTIALVNQQSDDSSSVIENKLEEALVQIQTASDDLQAIVPRGGLAELDLAGDTDIVPAALGSVGLGTEPDTKWYTGGGVPTKKTADYSTITFSTADFVVREGDSIRMMWTYTMDAELNMFEWFMWQVTVNLETAGGGADIENILFENEFFPATVNTSGVPGDYRATLNLGPTRTGFKSIVVPALTGLWPSDGIVRVTCGLIPHSALQSPSATNECFSGSTFDAASSSLKDNFKAIGMSISGEALTSGPTEINS